MKVLITGRGTSGSFQIRGHQLGQAIGAEVIPALRDGPYPRRAYRAYDLVVLVKRTPPGLVEELRDAGVPIVYDIVDAWPQPAGNTWDRAECMSWLADQVERIKPVAIVAATRVMAEDCGTFGVPVLHLPHHARPGQAINKVREHVESVGYEGSVAHLGRWESVLSSVCKEKGWKFHVKPSQLADLDIVVAMREAMGYAARHWKSNVKLANAQATGTPFIGCREAGYLETACGAERWADTEDELRAAFESLESQEERWKAADTLVAHTPRLDEIASTYKKWLESLDA